MVQNEDKGPELDALWQEFHDLVTMDSRELREFLRSDAAGEEGEALPGQEGALGDSVAAVLSKRKTDLTDDDVDTMRTVVEQIRGAYPDGDTDATIDLTDGAKRHWLMSLGHDPLKVR
ncbi:FliG-like protein [Motilibacter rhizosphaerae]|uniref:FliG-like protein n=1 Tax=Motilibacter rhizosphaerae TaxID=598652 RepID=A0A4Q7NSM7_9ACTN|nr:DUF3140 domain-containing protein [Motilibacter rhizosphaerae]RZS89974.1 FliG-like protein [Motilibacter rhizosphaerae]